MDDTKITVEELKAALAGDFDQLAEEMTATMNGAKAGRIIADSEEAVRDAHAEFRQKAFQRAVSLLQNRQKAFSPSAQRSEEQGQTEHDPSDD